MGFTLGLKDTWPLQQKWVWNNQRDEVKNCFICCWQVRNSRFWEAWKLAWSNNWVQLLSDNHLSDGWRDCKVQNAFLLCGSLSEVPNLFTLSCSSLVRMKDSQSLSDKRNVGVNIQPAIHAESLLCADECCPCLYRGRTLDLVLHMSQSLPQHQKPGRLP